MKKYKNVFYASLGGILEFYDFTIFLFFIDVFVKIFFPLNQGFFSELNAYITFVSAYLSRIVGGILMSHFADKYGRRNIFYISMLLMILPVFLLLFLPGYEKLGFISTIIFFSIRMLQGFAIGSEVSGAWIYVSEFVQKRQIPLALGFISATLTTGLLLGSVVNYLVRASFSFEELLSGYWKIPFVIAGVFGFFALFLRKKLQETPEFLKSQKENKLLKFPLKQAFKTHKKAMFVCVLMSFVLTSGIASLVILPSYFSSFGIENALLVQILSIFALIVGSFFQGLLSYFYSSFRICFIFSLCFIFFGINFVIFKSAFLYILMCFSQGIVSFAPIFMTQIFSTNLKSSSIGFAYNLSYALFAFLTPLIILNFYTNLTLYFVLVGLSSLYSIYLVKSLKLEIF